MVRLNPDFVQKSGFLRCFEKSGLIQMGVDTNPEWYKSGMIQSGFKDKLIIYWPNDQKIWVQY